MTTQPTEQEPSMDEILSSIRRIIADEATEDDRESGDRKTAGEAAEEDGSPPETVALAESGDDDPAASNQNADDDARDDDARDEDAGDEDVLELTEVVRETGKVIDLDVAITPPEPFKPFEPETSERSADDSERDDEPEALMSDQDDPATSPDDLAASQEDPGPAPADEPGNLERPLWSSKEPATDHPPSLNIAEIRDNDMANQETALQTPQNGIDPLVSDQAAGAATGAFAKLSQAVQRTPPELAVADDSGRTTEQFVEDMMRPMLREWLDQNLSPMVERIVQKEIQKLVRRAED